MKADPRLLDAVRLALYAANEDLRDGAPHLAVRLSSLFVRRIPRFLAVRILEQTEVDARLAISGELTEHGDASVGYPDFLHRVRQALSMPSARRQEACDEAEARQIADAYLSCLAEELPDALVAELKAYVPAELKHRLHPRIINPAARPKAA